MFGLFSLCFFVIDFITFCRVFLLNPSPPPINSFPLSFCTLFISLKALVKFFQKGIDPLLKIKLMDESLKGRLFTFPCIRFISVFFVLIPLFFGYFCLSNAYISMLYVFCFWLYFFRYRGSSPSPVPMSKHLSFFETSLVSMVASSLYIGLNVVLDMLMNSLSMVILSALCWYFFWFGGC